MVELPSGTVTFLFTDIEGSTRLLQKLRERYADVLAEHEVILREAFEGAGGHEIDTQGDAFFVAFRRARDAVAAAVAAQRALGEHEWPKGSPVRVRMGVHSGEPVVGGDRYVGLGVHRAARICSAAHGGQVLLSDTARGLVEDDLPDDVRVRDLGVHQLKDLDRPERLFQLEVDGLQHDFPPPRTERGDTDALVSGRERELAEAARTAVFRRIGIPRRRPLVAGALLVALAATVATILVLLRSSGTETLTIPANSVGLIDAGNGKVRKSVDVHTSPFGVAIGFRAVWVTNTNDGTVSRIDPDAGSVTQTIGVGTSPSGIAAGGDSIWVANHDDGTVSRISPQTNTEVDIIPVGADPTAVAADGQSVWVTNAAQRTVTRIDAVSGKPAKPIRTGALGRGVAVGGGSVWVTDESSRSVVQIDEKSGDVLGTISVGNGPSGIAYRDGTLWVANSLDRTVAQIDARTDSVSGLIRVGGSPSGVAVGPDGVWVTLEFAGRVARIDPSEGRVTSSLDVANRPKGIAVGEGNVWVAVQASGRGHRGGRLVTLSTPFDTIDPTLASDTVSNLVMGLVYDGLTTFRRVGGSDGTQLVPDLAAMLPTVGDGGKVFTFRLRPGIRYSDGSLVRPRDFRRSLERGLRLGKATPSMQKIVGATLCGERRCDLSQGVVASGDSLVIRTTEPTPRLPIDLSGIYPIPRGTPMRNVGTRPVPGTAPYIIESYAPAKKKTRRSPAIRGELTLVRNPHFHVWSEAVRPDGYPDEIVVRLGALGDGAVQQVLSGKADVLLGDTPPDRIAELHASHPRQLHVELQHATAFLYMNTRVPPFNDVHVRKAVDYAVDRDEVAKLHGGPELAQSTCQLVPPALTGYERYCPYTVDADESGRWKAPDLARARRLIAASHTRGERIVVWTFKPFFSKEGRYFVSLFRKLGYRAQLKELPDLGTYFTTIHTARPQSGLAGYFGMTVGTDIFDPLACDYPDNWARFCDRRLDRLVARAERQYANDPVAAGQLMARIDREFVQAAPWVPLFTPKFADLVSARVGNYQATGIGPLLDQIWVRRSR